VHTRDLRAIIWRLANLTSSQDRILCTASRLWRLKSRNSNRALESWSTKIHLQETSLLIYVIFRIRFGEWQFRETFGLLWVIFNNYYSKNCTDWWWKPREVDEQQSSFELQAPLALQYTPKRHLWHWLASFQPLLNLWRWIRTNLDPSFFRLLRTGRR